MNDLIEYQKQSIALLFVSEKEVEFEYDWCEYFINLYNKKIKLPEKVGSYFNMISIEAASCEEYTKVNIWYGKRSLRFLNEVFHNT